MLIAEIVADVYLQYDNKQFIFVLFQRVQVGVRKAEAARRRFSWKMGTSLLITLIVGLLWLDITENGKGSFESK